MTRSIYHQSVKTNKMFSALLFLELAAIVAGKHNHFSITMNLRKEDIDTNRYSRVALNYGKNSSCLQKLVKTFESILNFNYLIISNISQ